MQHISVNVSCNTFTVNWIWCIILSLTLHQPIISLPAVTSRVRCGLECCQYLQVVQMSNDNLSQIYACNDNIKLGVFRQPANSLFIFLIVKIRVKKKKTFSVHRY